METSIAKIILQNGVVWLDKTLPNVAFSTTFGDYGHSSTAAANGFRKPKANKAPVRSSR